MLFSEQDAPLVRAWLMKKLPEVSDTETDILADYVLALLMSQEGDAAQIRAACEGELPQFLNNDAAPKFVDELFRVVEYRSYVPGAPPPPRKRPALADNRSGGPPAPLTSPDYASQAGSQKRSYHERGDAATLDDSNYDVAEGRAYKQPRRGQWDTMMAPRGDETANDHLGHAHGTGGFQFRPDAAAYDPSFPQTSMGPQDWLGAPPLQMNAYPRGPSYGAPQGPRRNRQRCRDFATKGYCSRGSSCHFDHGTEPIWVSPSGPSGPSGPPKFEDFDPRDAAMIMSQNFQAMQQLMDALSSERGGRGGRRGRQGPKGRRRANRASFSAEGPVNDKTKTTIVIENIPEDHFSEEAVRGFFSGFGNIVEVTMQPQRKLAIVKYDTWKAANTAYKSPRVIFDNRFVRVFWYMDEIEDPAATGANGIDFGSGEEPSDEPELDMEEFLKKQEEAQRLHEERQKKKEELDRQRQELEQRQRDLLMRHREEQRKLQAKLAVSKDGDAENPNGEASTLNSALRAQLAALEDEAKLLGLDPSALDEPSPWYASSRGRGRGRSGFYPRGRGYAPRGRGSYRGGYKGDVHAAYAAYSLDNRPRAVAVAGLDLSSPEKDEALRQYLLGIGEFTDIQTTPSNTQITFKDRKTAEMFYRGASNREIPGIDTQLELSWVSTPLQPVKTPTEDGTPKAQGASDQDMAMGNAAPNGSSAVTMDQQPERHQQLDYDVADDEWGIE